MSTRAAPSRGSGRFTSLDGCSSTARQRVLFLSNYDGSLESYMDDFINKVGFGLNVVFSNGIGYPRTDWLVLEGAATSGSSRNTCAAIRCRPRSGTRPIRA